MRRLVLLNIAICGLISCKLIGPNPPKSYEDKSIRINKNIEMYVLTDEIAIKRDSIPKSHIFKPNSRRVMIYFIDKFNDSFDVYFNDKLISKLRVFSFNEIGVDLPISNNYETENVIKIISVSSKEIIEFYLVPNYSFVYLEKGRSKWIGTITNVGDVSKWIVR